MQDATIAAAVDRELQRMQVLGTSTRAPKEPHARRFLEDGYEGCPLDRWAASRVRILSRLHERDRDEGVVCRGCGYIFRTTDRRRSRCDSCRAG